LLDFVDYLVDWATDSPLLVLATARPELLERRPGWGGGKPNAATVSLSPLSEEDIARLLASLLEQAVMPAETQTELLARAGGNPLYAEEYARMISERGLAPGEDGQLPETVQGIVAARLDGLSTDDKSLLQDAAVIGKVFWSGALAAMNRLQRWTVEESLHRLERKEFVRRERQSSVASETEYAFRHVLVRDVAYGQVPRAARAEKHRLAAEWIESLSADREDRAEMLAHHYLSALEFARAAGQPTDAIADRARRAAREAGERAYALNSLNAAAHLLKAALDLTPEDDPERARLMLRYGASLVYTRWDAAGGSILEEASERLLAEGDHEAAAEAAAALGAHHWYRGDRERANPWFERAGELIEGASPSQAKASTFAELARFAMLGDHDARAVELGREALTIAEELGLESVRIRVGVLNTIGVARVKLGDRDGLEDIEYTLEHAHSGALERIRGYINLGSICGELGDLERSFALHEDGLREAVATGAPGSIRWLRAEVIWDRYLAGRWDDASARADEFLEEARNRERHYMDPAVYDVRAMIRIARGETDGGLADSESALVQARDAQDPQVLFPSLALYGFFLLHANRRAEAVRAANELLALLAEHRTPWLGYWTLPLTAVVSALGRSDELAPVFDSATLSTRWLEAARAYAGGTFEEAADVCADMGAVADEAFIRLRAAEALVQAGRRAEADAQLHRALAFYRSVGASAYIAEAEGLFAATA
jgi:tetratricopeptide (TPR) repeat protein